MKIVINRCFGGFGLSTKALKEYAKLKGFEIFFYKQIKYKYSDGEEKFERVDSELPNAFLSIYKKDFGKIVNNLHIKENEKFYFSGDNIERTDKDLIKVVELLGEEANGMCAKLKIIEIPDNLNYEIDNYDGIESIEEKHRSWY